MRSNLYSTHSDINYSIWYLIFFLTIPTWINSNVDIFPFCKINSKDVGDDDDDEEDDDEEER